jgi:hypothetical protein
MLAGLLQVIVGGLPINCPNALGQLPTGTVAVTLSLAVSITETVSLSRFATYTAVPVTLSVTLFVAVSIIETLLLAEFVIYANGAALAVLNSIKTIAAEMKAKEHDFCLLVKYFNSCHDNFNSNNSQIVSSIWEYSLICFLVRWHR